jgi:hypothetical protein
MTHETRSSSMAMDKKHFEAMASGLAGMMPPHDGQLASAVRRNTVRDVAQLFARIAAEGNPAFDRARFLAACGLET